MVRLICLDISPLTQADYQALYKKASEERRERADRYRFREDALRCLAGEALLRRVLGTDRYSLDKTPDGKPYVRELPDFHFNLSHSGDWVVLACGDSPVGVDVQQHRGDRDPESLARRHFTKDEQDYVLGEVPGKQDRFFEVWTGKESYLKFLGTGLRRSLSSFSVLQPEDGVIIHHRKLSGDCSLSLCTAEAEYTVEILENWRP